MLNENQESQKPFRLEGYPLTTRLQNLLGFLVRHRAEPGLTEEVEDLSHSVQSLENFALDIFSGMHESLPDYLDRMKSHFESLHRYEPVVPLDTTFNGDPPDSLGRGAEKSQTGGMSRGDKILLGIGIAVVLGIGYWLGYSTPIEIQVETWQYEVSHESDVQEVRAIDCGWAGGYVGEEQMRVEWFSCAQAFGYVDHNWTHQNHVSTVTETTCRGWLRGEGYCDGSGSGRANSQAELWGDG